MSELSNTLKNRAILLGLCTEWTEGWGNPDKQGLIDKYLHGIDFCIKHDYPTVDFIEKKTLKRNCFIRTTSLWMRKYMSEI